MQVLLSIMHISCKCLLIALYFTHTQALVQLSFWLRRTSCDGIAAEHDSIADTVHVATQHINTPRLANVKLVRQN